MRRLLALAMMLTLAVMQASAAPMSLCQHGGAAAHIEARESDDAIVAAAAHREEAAAAAADKQGSLSETAGASVGTGVLPVTPAVWATDQAEQLGWLRSATEFVRGRSIPPLLDPPLA